MISLQLNKLDRGKALDVRRYAAEIPVQELADAAGYSRQYMTRVLTGRVESPIALEKIEAALAGLIAQRQAETTEAA
jgi:transcriptional regulator with XRE-family HTH domain